MINSELQFVAVEIAEFVGEPKKVGFWIGIVKSIGKSKAYQIMSEMKQREAEYLYLPPERRPPPVKSKAKLFIWKAKNG
jgi:hypothetical protein